MPENPPVLGRNPTDEAMDLEVAPELPLGAGLDAGDDVAMVSRLWEHIQCQPALRWWSGPWGDGRAGLGRFAPTGGGQRLAVSLAEGRGALPGPDRHRDESAGVSGIRTTGHADRTRRAIRRLLGGRRGIRPHPGRRRPHP